MNLVLLFSIRFVAVAANQMLLNISYYTASPASARACTVCNKHRAAFRTFIACNRHDVQTEFVHPAVLFSALNYKYLQMQPVWVPFYPKIPTGLQETISIAQTIFEPRASAQPAQTLKHLRVKTWNPVAVPGVFTDSLSSFYIQNHFCYAVPHPISRYSLCSQSPDCRRTICTPVSHYSLQDLPPPPTHMCSISFVSCTVWIPAPFHEPSARF